MSLGLQVVSDQSEVAAAGADIVEDLLSAKAQATIVCATGRTPIGLYRELARRNRRRRIDLGHARVFQLDEYVGVGDDDPRSLYRWLERELLAPAAIAHNRVVRLRGDTDDLAASCASYDMAVAEAGGIDLAVLGLGPNGHLGFNEPPSPADAPTRAVELSPASIESNAGYWPEPLPVPTRALTAGMTVLTAARYVLLLVTGQHKQRILEAATSAPPTPELPASLLIQAGVGTILCDRAAAGRLGNS